MDWQPVAAARRLLKQERGTVRKDWGGRLPIALVFPNRYHVGMSSLAVHTLYRLWNAKPDTLCERVFTDWLPPASLETGAPLDHFPIVAFTLAYELDYFGVVTALRSANIPILASERDDSDPLVIAGGPAIAANPEPLAPILDAVLIGEIEPVFDTLTEALGQTVDGRISALGALGKVPGVYLTQDRPPSGPGVVWQWLSDLDAHPCHSTVLTPNTEFPNTGLIEIARGCSRGCRFCLIGHTSRPARERSVESVLAQARELLPLTQRLGLVSAAVSDHSQIDRLAIELRKLGARLSASSLRTDPLPESLIRALAESGTQTLTIAPEAGTQRLRRVIGKSQTEDDVLRAVQTAAGLGLSSLKLYFMVGLPTEQQADLQALVGLAAACAERFPRRVTVNLTPFVPKAHTPFQRLGQMPAREVASRVAYVETSLRQEGIESRSESAAWAEVQGTLARGDRRLADALQRVGHPTLARWQNALEYAGLTADELLAARPPDARLPWDYIEHGAQSPEGR